MRWPWTRPAFQAPQERVWAFKALMERAAQEIASGDDLTELKPARVLWARPDWKRTHIGLYAATVLRMKGRG